MAYPEHIVRRAIELKEGRSAGAVLRILEKEFPEEVASLNVRTILTWVRTKSELLVEPSVHIEKEREIIHTIVPGNWKEHNEQLADVAKSLLANDLESVLEKQTETQADYTVADQEGFFYTLDKEELSNRLDDNLQSTFDKYKDWFVKYCFIPHLEAELPEEIKAGGLWDGVINEKPYELIHTLRLLAARKTFKGTCPVCKDW